MHITNPIARGRTPEPAPLPLVFREPLADVELVRTLDESGIFVRLPRDVPSARLLQQTLGAARYHWDAGVEAWRVESPRHFHDVIVALAATRPVGVRTTVRARHSCNSACRNAVGSVCQCSCGGAGHGVAKRAWSIVGQERQWTSGDNMVTEWIAEVRSEASPQSG
jgi:hypothetical protein